MPDPFIDPQDLSDFIGRDVTADPGAIMVCDAACDLIRDLTEQEFNLSTSTIRLDGTGTDCIVLPQAPVVAAGTVSVNGVTITDYFLGNEGEGGVGQLFRGTTDGSGYGYGYGYSGYAGPVWPRGRRNIQVSYDHGYQVAGTVNEVPRSIRMVALMVAARFSVQGVATTETIGDATVTYSTPAGELTANEQRILYGYTHVF